jgi:starch synthase
MDLPLMILISRMDWQKGVDLALDALRMVAGLPWQAILLGKRRPRPGASVRQLEAEFPYRVRALSALMRSSPGACMPAAICC